MDGNSFIHPLKHLFIEHLKHARHSSRCLRYIINKQNKISAVLGRDLIIIGKFMLEQDKYGGKKDSKLGKRDQKCRDGKEDLPFQIKAAG